MPFRMAPMLCSRTPKCSVRPYGLPDHILVWRASGRKEGSPSIVVLLDSARSAEPPHSSGSTGASAVRILPEARRVPVPLGAAGEGREAAPPPAGGSRVGRPSDSGLAAGVGPAPAVEAAPPSAGGRLPR